MSMIENLRWQWGRDTGNMSWQSLHFPINKFHGAQFVGCTNSTLHSHVSQTFMQNGGTNTAKPGKAGTGYENEFATSIAASRKH